MRSDMHKVITERGRYGSSSRSWKTRLRISANQFDPACGYEDISTRLSSSRGRQYGYDARQLSDKLGPLRRYLRQSVGLLWDDVYSDFCSSIDRRNTVQNHLYFHLQFEVELNTFLDETGAVCYENGFPVYGWYVHPVSRLLCYRPRSF